MNKFINKKVEKLNCSLKLKRRGFCGIVKKVMLLLKERSICRQLNRYIWKGNHKGMIDFLAKREGVSMKQFTDWLFEKYIWSYQKGIIKRFWLFGVKNRINKNYISDFQNRNEDIIKDCIKDGYIEIVGTVLNDNTLLVLHPNGKRLIPILGFIQIVGRELSTTWYLIGIIITFIIGGLTFNDILNVIRTFFKL